MSAPATTRKITRRPRVHALIAAAGSGQRMTGPENKILLPLGGEAMIRHAVRAFQTHPRVERIGVIVRGEDHAALERCFPPGEARSKLVAWIAGGARRQDSVRNGLQALAGDPPDWVLVHDGARPFCTHALIDRVLAALPRAQGVVPVLPVTDTVRRIEGGRSEVVERANLFLTQTPQGFHWEALWEAHLAAQEKGWRGTDDAQMLEAALKSGLEAVPQTVPARVLAGEGIALLSVAGEAGNIKVTTDADYRYAEWLVVHRARTGSKE